MSKISCTLACLLVVLLAFAALAQDSEKGSPPPKPPTFQVPRGWQARNAGSTSLARFQIGEGDRIALMTVTGLNGDGGGLVANINRWRAQVGLKSLAEKDALNSAQPIKVDGTSGHALDLNGTDATDKSARRILVAVVQHGDQTWFFRLAGPSSLVAEQKSAFDGFLKSIRFEK
jgi:hypothetical protein